MDLQFYPTPRSLGRYAFSLFENKTIDRLLEPQAGRGDLIEAVHEHYGSWYKPTIDCVEIDFNNQAILREKGLRVVGHDFLQYQGGPVYSHIFMNPPFKNGAHHVLHAWKLLAHGEIVAILNAETVRNPCDRMRQLLVKLIDKYGSVEYREEAFATEDTQRVTNVEVALVHLRKESNFKVEFIDALAKEVNQEPETFERPTEIALNSQRIQNLVTAFQCALEAARRAVNEQVRAEYYANLVGVSIHDLSTNGGNFQQKASKEFNERYHDIKERAWSSVLRSSKVLDMLSSEAQRRVESEFKNICQLEFTQSNIYGFLEGISRQQGEIQMDMICDVFDEISKYHPKNHVHYCGWKSNAKHRVNAFRINMTRFILPHKGYQFTHCISFEDQRRLADFDKVFAMLDGKSHKEIYGLAQLFDQNHTALCSGERLQSDYFDARYYPGAGTYHFFPRRKDLVDRLNRVVGRHRAWLPPENERVPEGFWLQFEQAEKINKRMGATGVRLYELYHEHDGAHTRAAAKLRESFEQALESCGIEFDPDSAIAQDTSHALPHLNDDAA